MTSFNEHIAVAPLAKTFPDLLREQAERYGAAPAATYQGVTISYRDLLAASERVAGGLYALGLRRHDKIGLLIENRLEWLMAFFGAGTIGATVVPFSTWTRPAELEFLINDSSIRYLVAVDGFGAEDFLGGILDLMPELKNGASGASRAFARFPKLFGVSILGRRAPGALAFETLAQSPPLAALPPGERASPVDDAFVLYSSGSTSRPKAVHLQHYAVIENGFNIGARQGLDDSDKVFLAPPLFWAYGAANALPAAFTHGASLVLQSKFDPGKALDLLEQHHCTAIYTLPSMTSALVEHPNFSPKRTHALRKGLTIGTPAEVYAAAEQLGASEIANLYGSSETCGNCCVTPHDWPLEKRANTQGPPLPGVEIRIIDPETGAVLPDGNVGQAQVRGYLLRGYGTPDGEPSRDCFTADGFYRTGDLGKLESGLFYFAGREDDMIKRAGVNISPTEVEDILLQHPGVSQAAVVGVPDGKRGSIVTAFVVPANGSLNIDALRAHFVSTASKYKHPDRYIVSEALPMTATGKLLRKELRLLAAEAASG